MKKVTLSIPHFQESGCCRRARWLRQFGWRLNLANSAVAIAEVIALLAWDKTLPNWARLVHWPVLAIIFAIIFFNHRLGSWLSFIPETPDPLAPLAEFAAFPREPAAPQQKDEDGKAL